MDTKRIILCIFLILCTGCAIIKAATVDVSYRPQPAVLGVSQTRLHCQYKLEQLETFYGLSLYDAETQGNLIVEMAAIDTNSTVVWAPGAPQNIKDRARIIASPDDRSLDLQFDTTRCEDSNNIVYRCEVEYQANSTRQIAGGTVSIDVEARPKAPAMSVMPTTENVTEFTEISFTCSGNVGRPAGSFHWYTFNDDDGNINNVTLQATQGTASQGSGADSCTFNSSSVLTLNVTRREQGKRLVVRCRVYHPTQANVVSSQCQDPSTDYCATSQQIDVQYPVEVSVSSDAVTVEEGKGRTITCITSSNPLPYRVEWQKEGINTTLSSSNDLTLSNLTLSDTGNYVCTAFNMIGATTRNDSSTVFVDVQKTTTPLPTTTPTTTASTTGSGATETGQVSKADTDNLAIIIPVVIVAVIIIVIIIVAIIIVRKRKTRKEVEEPPEKPFNNHSGINAAQPDIVRNPYTTGSYDHPNGMKNEDGLAYAELQFDNKPRSRRPLAIDDSHTDYSDVSMPQV
ncbi:peroxidasin-like [Littorina saxatilis]|uniref:peroxidasin-like n=1 Tax=Littorina saxatilis TaxID=31220 RepID=UPI0038B48233